MLFPHRKSNFLNRISHFPIRKSDFLCGDFLFLHGKSDFLCRISHFPIRKSDFLCGSDDKQVGVEFLTQNNCFALATGQIASCD